MSLQRLASWPVEHGAGGVVGPAEVLEVCGPADRSFAWASLTKLLTALATLVAVEEETVDLDQPAGPPGATLRHLLAHASGRGPEPGQTLAAPGRRRIYSNAGIEEVGEVVARRSAMPFGEYVHGAVLEPLGMRSTRWGGSAATGTEGPLTDLLALAQELLRPSLIAAGTLAEATRPAFPGLAGVLPGFGRQTPNDWGLGFEIRGHKDPHWTGSNNSPSTFGHFGRAGCFLWVDRDADLACGCLTDGDFGPWAIREWPALSDDVLAGHRP